MSLWLFVPTHNRKVNMKKNTPSNPLPPAESLNLSLNAGAAQEQASQNNPELKRQPKRKGRRKSARSIRSSGASSQNDSESRWNRLKGRFAAKIGQEEPDELREVMSLYFFVSVCGLGTQLLLLQPPALSPVYLAMGRRRLEAPPGAQKLSPVRVRRVSGECPVSLP